MTLRVDKKNTNTQGYTTYMVNFSSLKTKSSGLERLTSEIEKLNAKPNGGSEDDRFWQPSVDKAGNGYAVIRFLPAAAVDGDDGLPWIRFWDHGFKGPTGLWYIERSRTTLGEKDPVSEANSVLWNSGNDDDKKTARDRKRRLNHVSNILVITDPANPENEGKRFLFKYGKKIFQKVQEAMQPQFADETPMNPFDFWKGANFKIKIRNVEGYRNYDKSEFDKPSALFDGDDAALEALWKSQYSLNDFLDPKHYKSYDELKAQLNRVLSEDSPTPKKTPASKPGSNSTERRLPPRADDDIPFDVGPTDTGNSSKKENPVDDEDLEFFNSLKK